MNASPVEPVNEEITRLRPGLVFTFLPRRRSVQARRCQVLLAIDLEGHGVRRFDPLLFVERLPG
jgi:hypothetical protein